jgi:acyl-CoA reductase-like NAD-dependent aldehyde dehydrogenase
MTTITTINPADGSVLAGYEAMGPDEIEGAIALGSDAARAWGQVPVAERAPLLVNARWRWPAGVTSGGAFINAVVASDPRLPFGGTKRSGYGCELAEAGVLEFTNQRAYWAAP